MDSGNSSDENYEVPAKKIKAEWVKSYSDKAMLMMAKMGYEKDKGLGKQSQGRLEPIVAVQQDGRKGFGLKADSPDCFPQWDAASEKISLPEEFDWISNPDHLTHILAEDLKMDLKFGVRKESIDNEVLYCDPSVLKSILESKSIFDNINDNELRRARSRCNPFETIRSSIFLNRAAVKMANIDSMCDFIFTNPLNKDGLPLSPENELLYFADICAGPGGFSEYILYRKSWEAKGFGFTLRGNNDFKLDKFFAGSPESFDAHYGVRDDGNIFYKDNQDSFAEYVLKHCETGVHFVMADGGFSVEGQENIQEILSKQLYLCQCLVALKILREDGSFVCKLFDLFTPFSVGLIYLMYKCFDKIAIIKPNSSRPANSERYLVCKWKKSNTNDICEYLDYVNELLNKNSTNDDVLEIVGSEEIAQDTQFTDYIIKSNNEIGQNQIIGLKKIAAFCSNHQLKEAKQSEIRKRCLELWKLPDKLRQPPEAKSTEKIIEEILGDWMGGESLLNSQPKEVCSKEALQKYIHSIHDWYFLPVGRGETSMNVCSLFLCKSKGNLCRYTYNGKWEPLEYMFEISPKSLFYGEIVYEYCGEGRTQTRVRALHIIDAIILGGKDIRRCKLSKRLQLCEKYALSLNKPYKDNNFGPIRSKRLYRLKDLSRFFQDMKMYNLKDNSARLGFPLTTDNKFFVPGGIMIICEINSMYFSNVSSSTQKHYYYDTRTHTSYYEEGMPPAMKQFLFASFRNSFQNRLLWKWTNLMQVEENTSNKERTLLYRDDFENFVANKIS